MNEMSHGKAMDKEELANGDLDQDKADNKVSKIKASQFQRSCKNVRESSKLFPQDMPDKQSDDEALVGAVPDDDNGAELESNIGGQSQGGWSVRTEQILEVETASNAEELASEAAERLLGTHEAEGEDVRVASGFGETMGRDIAELLKLEVKRPFPTRLTSFLSCAGLFLPLFCSLFIGICWSSIAILLAGYNY